jgi:hypothetical protein
MVAGLMAGRDLPSGSNDEGELGLGLDKEVASVLGLSASVNK